MLLKETINPKYIIMLQGSPLPSNVASDLLFLVSTKTNDRTERVIIAKEFNNWMHKKINVIILAVVISILLVTTIGYSEY